jgi:hypothetical protein
VVRAGRERGQAPACASCRRLAASTGRTTEKTELAGARRWWIEDSGLALDEIAEIAHGAFSRGGDATGAQR